MDPNLLKHIEYFLEPNSQVRTIETFPCQLLLDYSMRSCC